MWPSNPLTEIEEKKMMEEVAIFEKIKNNVIG